MPVAVQSGTATSAAATASQPALPSSGFFHAGQAEFQRTLAIPTPDGGARAVSFPHILQPASSVTSVKEYVDAAATLAAQPSSKEAATTTTDGSALRQTLTAAGGALVFRNTPLRTADDFSAFMHALARGAGWTPHVDKGLMVLRRPHAANVATANEGPPDQEIGSHNEYGLSSHYPSYIAFFCLSAPDKGGETPLASSLRLHDRFANEQRDYFDAITQRGIAFAIHHPRGDVANHVGGNGVFNPNAFGPEGGATAEAFAALPEQDKRAVVEANVRALASEGGWEPDAHDDASLPVWKRIGYSGHWLPDGSFIVVQRTPGVRYHPLFQRPIYHTNVHTRFTYANIHKNPQLAVDSPWRKPLLEFIKEEQREQKLAPPIQLPPYIVGQRLDDDQAYSQQWIDANLRITAEEQVDVKWQVGDVVLIDNLAVQHGRRPWQGDRRLLASLWDYAPFQQASKV